ncbi:MAG TPA: right-handed parallel beta-helix repeat-containing protein [Myxococcales bacterium]|nr:right-handed parallel beta-helix repeat-containing protein [Myxococcales bacterium]
MRRALLPLLLCAACTFDLPGSGDRWPCADGGGDACDQNGNPIPGTTGGPGSSAGTGSTAGGSSAGASGTSGRVTSTGTGTGTSGTGTAGTSSTAGSGSSTGSSSAAASSGGASTGASSSSSSGTGGSTTGGTSGGASSTGGNGTGASSSAGSATGGTSGAASSSGGSSGICPANGGTTVWVNQAAGSDATGTGVASPARCAYQTLTKGLTEAARGGYTFVVAEGASATGPVLFNSRTGESFPLQVPPGVTLSTDLELASQPANSQLAYTIDDDAASVAMVDLTAPGAAISGFTVVNHSGVGLEGLTCSDDGGVSLTDCTLLGSDAGGDGVNALGACDLALTNLTIEGFGATGIYSHTATTIDGGTIEGNGWTSGNTDVGGIWVAGGSLWLQNVTLGGNYFYGLQASAGTVTGQNVTFTGGPAGPDGGAQPVGLGLGVLVSAYPGSKNTLSTAAVTLTNVSVLGSAQDGIDLDTGTLNLLGSVAISGNGGHGLLDLGATVYLEDPVISGNGFSGVHSPLLAGGLVIDGGVIGPDDTSGNWAELTFGGSASVSLNGVTVQDNSQGVGVHMAGTGKLSMVDCDVTANSRGGVYLVSGTLTAFTGNRVHGNGVDQIYVSGGSGSWNLGAGGCTRDSNQIYCYAPGHVGLGVDAGAAVTAANDSWENATPQAGTDYTGNVMVNGSCAPVTTCP